MESCGRSAIHLPKSSAKDNKTGHDVAIKKVQKVFEKTILAKRALREIKLLRHFNGHENVFILYFKR
jgi:serine/threonine protein kinase